MPAALKTPDITPAQLVAVAASIATELFNAALISGRVEQLVIGLAGVLIPAVWIAADAVIRHGRARAAVVVATVTPPAPPVSASRVPGAFVDNHDGTWTRSVDGVRGTFGPGGFRPAAGAGVTV